MVDDKPTVHEIEDAIDDGARDIQDVETAHEYDVRVRIAEIARTAHNANRAYCRSIGDNSQSPWGGAPDWQRTSAIKGVQFHQDNPDAKASASHESWMRQKTVDGWIYGETKDEEALTHPCMVPFDDLPVEQQIKDHIFRSVVHAMLPQQVVA